MIETSDISIDIWMFHSQIMKKTDEYYQKDGMLRSKVYEITGKKIFGSVYTLTYDPVLDNIYRAVGFYDRGVK